MSHRLEKVLAACGKRRCIADIGTDHGLLPVCAIIDGRAEKAVACDLRKAPLEKCRVNIERYGVGDKVSVRQAYGLDALKPGEADAVVIAGMGGMLICEIISKALSDNKLFPGARLVLCPNTHDEFVRRMVYSDCFSNVRESAVRDGGMIYLLISCVFTGISPERGLPDLLEDAPSSFVPEHFAGSSGRLPKYYYRKVLSRAKKRLEGLKRSESFPEREKASETELFGGVSAVCTSFIGRS